MTRNRQIVVREQETRDLVVLARDAADVLRHRPGYEILADALDGASAAVIVDLSRAEEVLPV